jgi:hypothetical protein
MPEQPRPYDRTAIFHENGPFHPCFVDEAVRTLMRTLPLDPAEPRAWCYRRMHSALTALSALNPRDEIELMLGVQALSAYHAAAACWHIGMNHRTPKGDGTRHIASAATAARAFDSMLRAIERRQAKPLSVPVGRPDPQSWPEPNVTLVTKFEDRCLREDCEPDAPAPIPPTPPAVWSAEAIAITEAIIDRERIERENKGLDIANTEGILPGGGMVLTDDPTPAQQAYMARRLTLMYRREHAENQRNGVKGYPKIRGIHPGDLIP